MSALGVTKCVACLGAAFILRIISRHIRKVEDEINDDDILKKNLKVCSHELVCKQKTLSQYVNHLRKQHSSTNGADAFFCDADKMKLIGTGEVSEIDGMKTMARLLDSVSAAVDKLYILKNCKSLTKAQRGELEEITSLLQTPSERLHAKFLETAALLGESATDSTIEFLLSFSTPQRTRRFCSLDRRSIIEAHKLRRSSSSSPTHASSKASSMRRVTTMDSSLMKLFETRRASLRPTQSANQIGSLALKAKRVNDYKLPHSPELKAELELVDSWTQFDVFKIKSLTENRPLVPVAMFILERFSLFTSLNIDVDKMLNFLDSVESEYNCNHPANPYHNSTHAADVVQAMSVFIGPWGLASQLSDLEIFACLISAIIHDVGHPGVSNDFQVKRRHHRAVVYNDSAVNENHHVCRAFQIALEGDNNFLDCLSIDHYKDLRRMVIQMVVGTDMSQHFASLAQFTSYLAESTNLRDWPDPMTALKLVMHASDISNPGKPEKWAIAWAQLIVDEFSLQGDLEKTLGMPVSPLCDRYQNTMPRSQLGFINLIVRPTFEALSELLPAINEEFMPCLEQTRKCWAERVAELEALETKNKEQAETATAEKK